MSMVPSTVQEVVRSPYDSLYQQSYDGIHRRLSRGWCDRWRGLCIRPLRPSPCADDISQAAYEGLPKRRSGELAAFVHAEQLLDAHRSGGNLHRGNARTVRRHLSAAVGRTEAQCVRIVTCAQPVAMPRPIALDQPCVTSHTWLQDGVLRRRV